MEIIVASPNSFCAGVDRAINIVKYAISIYGPPIYVRHQIVHNQQVVQELESMGAIFIDNITNIPSESIVITSAHGISKKVADNIKDQKLLHIDAACPLVLKVHAQAQKADLQNKEVIFIGHKNHPETIGTCGQIKNKIHIISEIEDIDSLIKVEGKKYVYLTQTTLSVNATKEIIAKLEEKFHGIEKPKKQDICYATQNRQIAVREVASKVDMFVIFGSLNSSNTLRLVEVARESCKKAFIVENGESLDIDYFKARKNIKLGLSSGASCPQQIITDFIEKISSQLQTNVHYEDVIVENEVFSVPKSKIKNIKNRL